MMHRSECSYNPGEPQADRPGDEERAWLDAIRLAIRKQLDELAKGSEGDNHIEDAISDFESGLDHIARRMKQLDGDGGW